eukprot:15333255-Ditylum_brightwellii.AAC.1
MASVVTGGTSIVVLEDSANCYASATMLEEQGEREEICCCQSTMRGKQDPLMESQLKCNKVGMKEVGQHH